MSALIGGILLPESVLSSTWFALLATVVAFNTIVYVGLTLSKLVPLPKQIHPSQVRRWLAIAGMEVDKESAMNSIQPHQELDPNNPYEGTRGNIAARSIPQAFSLVGILVVAVAIGAFLLQPTSPIRSTLVELVGGLVFLVLGQLLGRNPMRPRTTMWIWAVACAGIVMLLVVESVTYGTVLPLVYALIVMASFPVVTLAWRPSFVCSVLMLAAVTYASLDLPGADDARLVIAAVSATLIGLALLRIRLIAIDAIADEQARAASFASTDPLTQTLTRTGLRSLMPSLGGIAERIDSDICVMYIDVDQLAQANSAYGADYGDEVLRTVAQAIRDQVRVGDLVARWEGDEFLVAGIGQRADAQAVADRIVNAVRVSGINLGRWPTTVTVGTSAGSPTTTTFEALVADAKSAMSQIGAGSSTTDEPHQS